MGVVIAFPGQVVGQCAGQAAGRFTPHMRAMLHAAAAAIPGADPVSFDHDDDGTEFARLGPGLAIGWDDRRRLVLIDTRSGFVERGPFADLAEVCDLVLFLAGVRGFQDGRVARISGEGAGASNRRTSRKPASWSQPPISSKL